MSKNFQEAEFRNLLADLSNKLAEAKLEIAGLKEDLVTLKHESAQLKTTRVPREKPRVKCGRYIFPPDESLYCSAYYDTMGLKSLIHRVIVGVEAARAAKRLSTPEGRRIWKRC